jgi:2-dehydro-3-deoxy-D-gluconate 5-dehydrogenase
VAARDTAKAKGAVAELGSRSVFVALDVADESSCRAMIDQTKKRFGRLDILVNNAGTSIRKPRRPIPRPNGIPCSTSI